MYKGRTYTTFIIPSEIWVTNTTPRVDASGAALENHKRVISAAKIHVTISALIL